MQILVAVMSLSTMGLIFGLLLAIASKYLSVEKDERVSQILNVLPGANCGGCGFVGCSDFAKAVAEGRAKGSCPVGGPALESAISDIMGVKVIHASPKRAVVVCHGNNLTTKDRYKFEDVHDCFSANLLGGGSKACQNGCLGFYSCVNNCHFGAMEVADGRVVINDNCTACGVCVDTCPKKLIKLIPKEAKYIVKCSSTLSGVDLKDKCIAGCIGCGICKKNCPTGAIEIINNSAVIDYSKCVSCGKCAEKCPKKVITKIDNFINQKN